jgi:hypothetical protein
VARVQLVRGGYRSRCEVNADLPVSILLLAELGAHEAYPGHHTERVAKEAGLYRQHRRVETSVAIIIGPECIVAEGIATNALEQALGNAPFAAIAEVLAGLGIAFDPSEAQEVYEGETLLEGVGTNAAFMLYEDGVTTGEAEEYMREWALASDERAARAVSFITDPASRTYVSTYGDGRRLVRDYAERAPGNFTKLLTEQLTTADLAA